VAAGDGLVARLRSIESRAVMAGWAVLTAAIGVGIVALPIGMSGRFDPVTLVPFAAALLVAALALRAAWRAETVRAATIAVIGSIFVLAPTLQWVMPRVDAFWLSRSAAALVARAAPADAPRPVIGAIGYQEPSLVFLLGRDTVLVRSGEAAAFFREHPEGLLLLGDNVQAAALDALHRVGREVRALGTVRGFNYSKGRWLTLTLYKAVPPSPDGWRGDMDRAQRSRPAPGAAG
jgi:hypothetical protein